MKRKNRWFLNNNTVIAIVCVKPPTSTCVSFSTSNRASNTGGVKSSNKFAKLPTLYIAHYSQVWSTSQLHLVRQKMRNGQHCQTVGGLKTCIMIAFLPGIAWVSVEVHDIETSSEWLHEWTPQPRCGQEPISDSLPVQRTLSSQIRPLPAP